MRQYANSGSEAAFETLVNRRIGFVYSCALRQVRDPDLAEGVTQSVFTRAAPNSCGRENTSGDAKSDFLSVPTAVRLSHTFTPPSHMALGEPTTGQPLH